MEATEVRKLTELEDRHWWYRGRRQVLERVIAGLRLPARARILDAGCGSGRNMVELTRHGEIIVDAKGQVVTPKVPPFAVPPQALQVAQGRLASSFGIVGTGDRKVRVLSLDQRDVRVGQADEARDEAVGSGDPVEFLAVERRPVVE